MSQATTKVIETIDLEESTEPNELIEPEEHTGSNEFDETQTSSQEG